MTVTIKQELGKTEKNVDVIFVRGIKMTLKQVVKRLRGKPLWDRIYRKWLQRRHRNEEKISLEDARKEALLEYYTLKEAIKYEQKPPEHEEPEEEDYYVMVGGKPMLNSKWKELMRTQRDLANTDLTPSPNWELRHIHYLKNLFREDKDPSKKKRTVDMW